MALTVLFLWPFVSLTLFSRFGLTSGLLISIFLGYLFLPEAIGIDLPGLPAYTKDTALAVVCLIGLAISRVRREPATPTSRQDSSEKTINQVLIFLFAVFLISPTLTVLTNGDPIPNGGGALPALGFRDMISMTTKNVLLLIPFVAARHILKTEKSHRDLLILIVGLGLFYSLLVLFERRMSPQLHTWVYGYFQHIWAQHERGGGFRPIVFLKHGLYVGFFMLTVSTAAFALFRDKAVAAKKTFYLLSGLWLFLILLVSRNMGAAMLGLLIIPLVLLVGRKIQFAFMIGVSCLMIALPAAQTTEIYPNGPLVSLSSKISEERAASLYFRIVNEQALLARANERPLFGWGIWARWRIYNEFGEDQSTVDGTWIGTLGETGWIGYLAFFGALSAPLFLLARAARRVPVGPSTAAIGLILAANLLYMIPNSASGLVTWLLAGALVGFCEQRTPVPQQAERAGPDPRKSKYTRFPVKTMIKTTWDKPPSAEKAKPGYARSIKRTAFKSAKPDPRRGS